MSVINATPLLAAAGGDYQISRSVRLRSSASATFSRTPASASNRRTWTWSAWVKRGQLAGNLGLFSAKQTKDDITGFYLNSNDKLIFIDRPGNVTNAILATTLVFRDPSAWYHIMVVVDSTQATNTNRIKFFVNGVQTTQHDAATYPSQNYEYAYINNTTDHRIGMFQDNTAQNFDGYLTEINFIDGQALTPSSFGETDAVTGVWKPKKYAGTYGTNGFYLNFSDPSAATAAAIGKDYSGNGNNWTPNNISVTAGTTYDSMVDVPTLWADGGNGRGNYCVVSPIDKASNITVSNGNLTASYTGATDLNKYRGTIECPVGAWYWEVTVTTDPRGGIGIGSASSPLTAGGAQTYTYHESGKLFINNVDQGVLFGTYAAGDVIGVAVDVTGNTVRWYKNGVAQGSGTTSISSAYAYFATGSCYSAIHNYNFGQRPFAYTPPTGFKALNTQSLPEPTIKKGNQYMAATTYTGNGGTQSVTNSGGFQPDFAWVKGRNVVTEHVLMDAVRGAGSLLRSNATAAEAGNAGDLVTSFNSGGITVNNTYLGAANGSTNGSSSTYVAWQWKANGAAVSNTAGSITSQVSAGVSQGFSVVTYTGTGANATVGHGLGVAPKMVIVKNRTTATGGGNWPVYHASQNASPASGATFLNLTNAFAAASQIWNSTAPTSSVFSVGTSAETNFNGATYVAYLFAEVAGFSKFGSYTGNGSADGPFVFCGFRPRFVLIKRTDSAENWEIIDTARNAFNAADLPLYPNLSNAEAASPAREDILSNGFKLRTSNGGVNASGATYIFAAFAEAPFRNSLAR